MRGKAKDPGHWGMVPIAGKSEISIQITAYLGAHAVRIVFVLRMDRAGSVGHLANAAQMITREIIIVGPRSALVPQNLSLYCVTRRRFRIDPNYTSKGLSGQFKNPLIRSFT